MSAVQIILIISVAVAAVSIVILMLDDVFNELDRRRLEDEIHVAARRYVRQRHS